MLNRLTASVLGCGLALILISGCTSLPQKLEVSAVPIEKPKLTLPKADVVTMREVKWIVLTPENWEAALAELKKSGRPVVVFALTDKGYEALGLNFSDVRALVQQQQSIIAAYESYYTETNEAIDKANESIGEVNSEVDNLNKKEPESTWDKLNPFK